MFHCLVGSMRQGMTSKELSYSGVSDRLCLGQRFRTCITVRPGSSVPVTATYTYHIIYIELALARTQPTVCRLSDSDHKHYERPEHLTTFLLHAHEFAV
jgi:hypothetical protein